MILAGVLDGNTSLQDSADVNPLSYSQGTVMFQFSRPIQQLESISLKCSNFSIIKSNSYIWFFEIDRLYMLQILLTGGKVHSKESSKVVVDST